MARINLLPWRTERRKARQKEFYGMLGAAAIVGVIVAAGIYAYFSGQIDGQNARNAYLNEQIAIVQRQNLEIEQLERKRAQLLQRKEVIERLQAQRSQMVHLFDELVRTLPEGVRLTSIRQAGQVLTLEGQSQSFGRVSSYIRNFEASDWMANPDLVVIDQRGTDRGLPYVFTLRVNLSSPRAQQRGGEDAVAAIGMEVSR